MNVVIRDASCVLAHVPNFVRYGSKPYRDILEGGGLGGTLERRISSRLRNFEDVVRYPPNQVFIGNLYPDELNYIKQPWFKHPFPEADNHGKLGEILTERELYGWIKIADEFDLVWLTSQFINKIRKDISRQPLIDDRDIHKLGPGVDIKEIEEKIREDFALPLFHDDSIVGCIKRDHDKDESLKAHVLLENLIAKASGAHAVLNLLKRTGIRPREIDFILNCSEEAVGDRYNRGGGSLSKAIGEMCHCVNASGHDIKAFCAAPIHAIVDAACLVKAGVFKKVLVVGGGCLAKIGMKYAGHLRNDMPILEDVVAGISFVITADDGESPIIRLDCVGKHDIGAASSQEAIMTSLVLKPLQSIGKKICDIDKYATEMHNPEVTLPAGSGNTPLTNYRIMAALAVLKKEITQNQMDAFVKEHGMPGFSPTQGHVPAAVPFLGHALKKMRHGEMKNSMFVAKGSLFLGRMSQLSDGLSFLMEKNPKGNSKLLNKEGKNV